MTATSRPRHISASERMRLQEDARLRAAYPYIDEHADSEVRKLEGARQPRSLTGYVRWLRYAWSDEPPTRIHVHAIDAGGTPAWSGEFMAWIEGISSGLSLLRDHEPGCPNRAQGDRRRKREECGCYYRWPLRAALFEMHGRFEDTPAAAMADWCVLVASTDTTLPTLAQRVGLPDPWGWTVPLFTEQAIWRLWTLYSPLPRSL